MCGSRAQGPARTCHMGCLTRRGRPLPETVRATPASSRVCGETSAHVDKRPGHTQKGKEKHLKHLGHCRAREHAVGLGRVGTARTGHPAPGARPRTHPAWLLLVPASLARLPGPGCTPLSSAPQAPWRPGETEAHGWELPAAEASLRARPVHRSMWTKMQRGDAQRGQLWSRLSPPRK